MKKVSYMLLGLFALILGSCSDDFTDWAGLKTNAQEDAITIPGFTATSAGAIDLGNVTEDKVATFQLSTATLPADYSLTNARIDLTPTGVDNATTTTFTTPVTGVVTTSDLQALVESFYGKAPQGRTFKGHVYASATKDGESVLIDAGPIDLVITPKAPDISPAYYVIGGTTDWNSTAARTQKFNHSDKSVYDDPVFTITIPAANGGDTWFAIADDKALDGVDNDDWSQILGTTKGNGKNGIGVTENLDTRAKIKAADASAGDASFCVPASTGAQYISITINMLDYTYIITPVSTELYWMVGNMQGWNEDGARKSLFYPTGVTTASYTAKWQGAWDLKIWKTGDIGNWDNAFGSAKDGDGSVSGSLVGTGAQSFQAPTKNEYYTLEIDMAAHTYNWVKLDNQNPTAYKQIGLIGNAGDWNNDIVLEQVNDHNWYKTGVTLSGDAIKFRADAAWTSNWGTDKPATQGSTIYGVGTNGGQNIPVTAGTYTVFFNDITGQFAFVPEK